MSLIGCAFAAEPVDGYYFTVGSINSSYGNNNTGYDADSRSLYGIKVANGGVLHMAPGVTGAVKPTYGFPFNVFGIKIGGLNFSNTCWCIYVYSGDPAPTMIGARPFIYAEEMTYGPRIGPRYQVRGLGTNTLVKTGPARLWLDDKPINNFANVEVVDGYLSTTSVLDKVISSVPVTLKGGGLSYRPNPADALEYNAVASVAPAGITVDSPYGDVILAKGENATMALTSGAIELTEDSLLSIDHTGTLGSSEKFISAGRTPGDENAAIVLRNTAISGKPYSFATYSAENGFTAKSSSEGVIKSGSAVLVNTSSVEGFTSEDAINFNQSRGLIWKASPAAAVEMKTPIHGANGVVFAGRYDADAPASFAFADGSYCNWAGGTDLVGVRAIMRTAKPFPDDAPVRLHGVKRYGSSSLYFESSLAPENDFILSGWGYQGDGAVYAAQDAKVSFEGSVELVDSARFGGGEGSSISFAKPLSGSGMFELASGEAVFSQKNAHGATHVRNGVLTVSGTGTFGSGKVTMAAGKIVFDGASSEIVSDIATSGGTVELCNGASPVFSGPGSDIAALTIESGSELQVSGYVKVNGLVLPQGASIKGAGGTIELYCKTDTKIDGSLLDGSGKLSVVKSGPGVLELSCANKFTGTFTVKEGEVRLLPENILKSAAVLYHLDATRPESVFCDENGFVTNWMSVSGKNPVSFGTSGIEGVNLPSNGVADINGKPALTFTSALNTRLVGSASMAHRVVFIVTKPKVLNKYRYMELFGCSQLDCGLRCDPPWDDGLAYWSYCSSFLQSFSAMNLNGSTTATEDRGREEFKAPVHVLKFDLNRAAFVPSIGGFHPTDFANRSYQGEIGEVIAFNRQLTEEEVKSVENYLGKKWGVSESGFHDGVSCMDARPASFAATSLHLAHGGILDVNGCEVEALSLTGTGTLRNGGANFCAVNASGTSAFSGVIGSGVTLAASGDLNVSSGGGEMVLRSGSGSFGAYVAEIPSDGLLYHLDATKSNSMLLDDSGYVTNWSSQAGSVKSFYWDKASSNNNWVVASGPTVSESGINGKPALNFTAKQALRTGEKVSPRTLFIVAKPTAKQPSLAALWGSYAEDRGVRFRNSTSIQYTSYFYAGAIVRVCGVDQAIFSDYKLVDEKLSPYQVTFSKIAGAPDVKMYNSLNLYNLSRGGKQLMGEVIAYSRSLSMEEIVQVENYLRAKWMSNDALADSNAAAISGIVVGVDADNKVVPVEVSGDIALAPDATLTYEDTPARLGSVVLDVDGEVTGDFAEIEKVKGMMLTRSGNTWRLKYLGMTIFLK